MRFSLDVTISTIVLILIQSSLVKSQATLKCKDHEIKMSKQHAKAILKCMESSGIQKAEDMTAEKIPCLTKCFMDATGTFDKDGQPNREKIMQNIDETVSGVAKEVYKKDMEKCLDEHGKNIDPSVANCASYMPLLTCAGEAFEQICRPGEETSVEVPIS